MLAGIGSTGEDDIMPAADRDYDQTSSLDEIADTQYYNKKHKGLQNRCGGLAATAGKGTGAFASAM
jgi:hypothetical protein